MNDSIKQHLVQSLKGGSTQAQPLSVKTKALVFSDPRSKNLLNFIERISPSEAPVLIGGDTGTGKELIARHIHRLSGRTGPFMVINCGAINDHLADSELFGHEAGAFTGAIRRREGWFEAANGGTLFLDEICDLPLSLQVKLLRVLQEKEIVRLGSRESIPVNVRLVAATNVDIDSAVAAGNFRRDLFYRINIAHIKLPGLSDRPADIYPLAEHFLKYYSKKMKIKKPKFAKETVDILLNYSWPGNIRELENVIHFALLVSNQDTITPQHLKIKADLKVSALKSPWKNRQKNTPGNIKHSLDQESNDPLSIIGFQLNRLFQKKMGDQKFDTLESLIIHHAFAHASSNQVHCSALLGISRNVTRRLLKCYGLLGDYRGGREDTDNAEFDNKGANNNHESNPQPAEGFQNYF